MMIENSFAPDAIDGGSERRPSAPLRGLTSLPMIGFVVLGLALAGRGPNLVVAPAGDVLRAASTDANDYDLDGLTNITEEVLGSSPYLADTDGDGFGDLEEFARKSDPSDPASVPLPSSLSLNMSARGENDGLHVQFATFFTDAQLNNKQYQFGVVVDGEVRFVPGALTEPGVTCKRYPTLDGQNNVLIIDVPFPESVVHALGEISIFATQSVDPSPSIVAAAGVDLVSIDGVVTLLQASTNDRWTSVQSQSGGAQGSGPSAGSVYVPIPPGGSGSIPQGWTSGMICYQATIEIGSEEGVLTQEVVAADCISDFDASCPPSCGGSVGETFETFDPIGLIGG